MIIPFLNEKEEVRNTVKNSLILEKVDFVIY